MANWLNNIVNMVSAQFRAFFRKKKRKAPGRPVQENAAWFPNIRVVEKTPPNSAITERDFVEVVYKGKPMWALFKCPCNCGSVISLSLQALHTPHWELRRSPWQRPTLYPSVFRTTGCRSHFWVRDGNIEWAYFVDERR